MSQLQRMFLFDFDEIQDDDIVITSDADVFVRDPQIFEDILDQNYKIW